MTSSDSTSDDAWEDLSDSEEEITPRINAREHFAYCSNPEEQEGPKTEGNNFMDTLLESSENSFYLKFEGQNIHADDWDEAVIGWKEITPNAKYLPRKKRRKNIELDEKQRGVSVRGTNDYRSEDTQNASVWKSNVEPVTYRYIPNNGQYRLHKFCKEEREWYTVRKRHAERVTPTLKARYVQREIKRQLKKDFNKKSSNNEKNPRDVKRSQSTNSEGHREKTSSSFGLLVKSASDLYVENINTRLNELDEEIKKDSRILKTNDEQGRPFPFNVTKGKLHSKLKDTPVTLYRNPSEVQSAFIITQVGPQDTLRPLEKITPQQRMKEDLVKVNPKKQNQDSGSAVRKKQAEDSGGSADRNPIEDLGGGDTPSSETMVQSAIDLANFDLERLRIMPLAETSRTYIDKIVKNKQGSSNGTGNVNKKMGSRFVSSITVDQSGISSIEDIGIRETDTQNHSSRSRRVKDPNLPEIAGRRLEVSLTTLRLL